jgi:hypothetical protein
MTCIAREKPKKNPYKSDAASTSNGYNPLKTKQPKNKLTVYLVDVTSADHGDRALLPDPKQNLERKPNRISRECFPDEVLHGSGLEFRRATQGREGGRKGVGVIEREDAHVQKAAFVSGSLVRKISCTRHTALTS